MQNSTKKLVQSGVAISLLSLIWLLSPMPANAQSSEVTALTVYDTTAGSDTMAIIRGSGQVQLIISGPAGKVSKPVQINQTAIVPINNLTKSGTYAVLAGNKSALFTVHPAEPVVQADAERLVRQNEPWVVSVKALDAFGNAVTDLPVSASTTSKAPFICEPSNCQTDSKGNLIITASFNKTGFHVIAVQANGKQVRDLEVGVLPGRFTQVTKKSAAQSLGASLFQNPAEEGDFLRIMNEEELPNGLGGDSDSFLAQFNFFDYLKAQATQTESTVSSTSTSSTVPNSSTTTTSTAPTTSTSTPSGTLSTTTTIPQPPSPPVLTNNGFDIAFAASPIEANIAQDIIVKRVDATGVTVQDYSGTIRFRLSPPGPLLPSDFIFIPAEHKGEQTFEIAVILPLGSFTLTVEDVSDASLMSTLQFTTVEPGAVQAPASDNAITLASPVQGSVYSGTISVQGSTSKPNTQITVKEGTQLLGTTNVDANRAFDLPITFQIDGPHTITLEAAYIPENTFTSTTVTLTVDRTPPVVTSVNLNPTTIRSGEPITISVISEPKAQVTAFINNASYEFSPSTSNVYTITINAPFDAGTYPINLEVRDQYQNTDNLQNLKTLIVTPPLPPVANFIGIPGVESITLQWAPIPEAVTYKVSYTHNNIPATQNSSSESLLVSGLTSGAGYNFTIVALNAQNQPVSLETPTSLAIKPLEPPHEAAAEPPVSQPDKMPPRTVNSGPEVYVIIALSILFLNLYAKIRRDLT